MGRGFHPWAVIAVVVGVGVLSVGSRGFEPHGWDRVANAREIVRIQAHLAQVEDELRARSTSSLTPAQRANRARAIENLHRYWQAGRFPHNHDFPGERVPYFQDRHGTPCAMAYLIAQSGRQDLVDRVTTVNNNGTVFELAADHRLGPALSEWLRDAGLTLEEAARIQPEYDGVCRACIETRDEISTGYWVASLGAGSLSVASIGLNADRSSGDRQWQGFAGVGAGVVVTGLGLSKLDAREDALALGVTNTALGLLSVGLGVRTLIASAGPSTGPVANRNKGRAIQPVVFTTPSGTTALGVRLTL